VDKRAERRAKNEALLREVNERRAAIDREAGDSWADANELFEFVCECGAEDCEERIELTLDEYDEVRQQDDRFPVVPGHGSPEIETVVERHERYVVVDKKPELEPLVADDPRGAPSR
jgi:hypothetical protein